MAMEDRPDFDPEILRYYSDEWDEDARLRSGLAQIELIRTQEIIRRYLPDGPLRIADVGGGSGVHAEWLLDDGHAVHLIEPVRSLVETAASHITDQPGFSCEVGDARHLTLDNSSVDAALLLGPLYHLTEKSQRLTALREALRVVKPGGLLFASTITRFAPLADGLGRGMIFDPDFEALVRRTLIDGQHRNPPGKEYFTTAFCHRPDGLQSEVEEAGWSMVALLGVEGFTMAMPQLNEAWDSPEQQALIVDMARAIESEPSLLGLGPHLMAIARHSPSRT